MQKWKEDADRRAAQKAENRQRRRAAAGGQRQAQGGGGDGDAPPEDAPVSVKKRRKTTARCWQFFSEPVKKGAQEIVTCNLCQKEMTFCGTTSNLHKHLRTAHKSEWKEDLRSGELVPVYDVHAADTGGIHAHKVSC